MNKIVRQGVQLVFVAALALAASGVATVAKPASQAATKAKAAVSAMKAKPAASPAIHNLEASLNYIGKAKLELEELKPGSGSHGLAALADLDKAQKECEVALDEAKRGAAK